MGAGPAGEPAAESGLPEADEADILEERAAITSGMKRAALPVVAVEAAVGVEPLPIYKHPRTVPTLLKCEAFGASRH